MPFCAASLDPAGNLLSRILEVAGVSGIAAVAAQPERLLWVQNQMPLFKMDVG